jgi:hypothetical protein
MNQTDNSFFKLVSPLYLGRPSDQRGLAPCVEALTAAGYGHLTGNRHLFRMFAVYCASALVGLSMVILYE